MKVLVAVDRSRCTEAALQMLAGQMEPSRTQVCVFHAVEPPNLIPYTYVGKQENIDAAERKAMKHARKLVTPAEESLRKAGFAVQSEVEEGDARLAIVRYARSWNADLILLGSHGRKGVNRFVTGSVSEYVARRAPCSVLIARN